MGFIYFFFVFDLGYKITRVRLVFSKHKDQIAIIPKLRDLLCKLSNVVIRTTYANVE